MPIAALVKCNLEKKRLALLADTQSPERPAVSEADDGQWRPLLMRVVAD